MFSYYLYLFPALTSTSQDTIPYDASPIESEAALGNHMGNLISEPNDYHNSWKAKRLQKTLVKERLASHGGGYTPWGRQVHGENGKHNHILLMYTLLISLY
jgi:hypothetical protein